MDSDEQIRVLQAAQGDPAKLALATVDLAYSTLPDAERTAIKEALKVAAIPHWCDESLLAALLQVPEADAARLFGRLRGLRVVEPFPARGSNAVNVHEVTRLALRNAMAADPRSNLGLIARRLVEHFATDVTSAGRIEWIYHLLYADPDRGAAELEMLGCDWAGSAPPEDRYALAAALEELGDTGIARGRARVWVLLVVAWTRVGRGEAARLAHVATEILRLARDAADQRAEADAQALLGDVLRAQGKLEEAHAAYGENLAISRRLAEQAPANAFWQRDLAVAYGRVGDVLQAQGKLEGAQAAYGQDLAISRWLTEQAPSNTGWQRILAVANSRVGDILQAQGKLEEAQAAYREYLAICRGLSEQDPDNAGWQRVLAVANSRVGDVLLAQGELDAAETAYGEYLAISRRLADRDPTNAAWQRELGVAKRKAGDVLEAQGWLAEAEVAYGESLAISRRLVDEDSSNAAWQRDLTMANSQMDHVLRKQGKLKGSQAAQVVADKRRIGDYDVFLCHRSADRDAVEALAARLTEHGLLPWIVAYDLQRERSLLEQIDEQIDQFKSAVVCIGRHGIGPWEEKELRSILDMFASARRPVFPVFLPGIPATKELPPFLRKYCAVDLRGGDWDQLVWDISGKCQPA